MEIKTQPGKAPEASNLERLSPEEVIEAWNNYQFADNLFHTRQNIYLVAHTILLAGFMTIIDNENHKFLAVILAVMGAIVAINWFFVARRLPPRTREMIRLLKQNSRVFERYITMVPQSPKYAEVMRDYFLPWLFIVAWFSLLGWKSLQLVF